MIVGSPPDQRGVVCAASYEARKFKVRSAMPSRTAARLCPQGIFVRPRMDAYRAESDLIMEILRSITPTIEKVSVDEAYLDVSNGFQTVESDAALESALPQGASKLVSPANVTSRPASELARTNSWQSWRVISRNLTGSR